MNALSKIRYCAYCGSPAVAKKIDGHMRSVCTQPDCGFVLWNNPVPVVAALVRHGEQYLIARNVSWPKGIFSVITGFMDPGEAPEVAVLREVKEELGLVGEIAGHIGNYMFTERNQLILCFEVAAQGEVVTNEELAEVKSLTKDAFVDYDFSPLTITQQIMRDWKNKQ